MKQISLLNVLCSLICYCLLHTLAASAKEEIYELHRSLLRKYNKNVVPRQTEEKINVNVSFHLLSLLRFDEREETLMTAAWLSISWKDDFLMWTDKPNYKNVSYIFLKQTELWKPDIMLINTAEHFQHLGSKDLLVTVDADGKVTWEPGNRFITACSLNIDMYPFDSQRCSLLFSTWTHDENIVMLTSISDKIELDQFEENGEWHITSTSANSKIIRGNTYGVPQLNVTLTLHRRRMYYVLTVCIPIVVLSVLNCMVYMLPPDSGDKISFCLTILLAYMVYISLLGDNLPRTSKSTSYLVLYLSLMICLSFLSVMNSVVVLVFWHKTDQNENQVNHDEGNEVDPSFSTQNNVNLIRNGTQYPKIIASEINNHGTTMKNKIRARRFDKFLFVFMSMLTASITVVIITLLITNP